MSVNGRLNGTSNGIKGLNGLNGHNGHAAALSPTADADVMSASSRLLSSSISSLHGRPSSSSQHITKAYRQASTLFLTRRLPEALSTLRPLISPTTAPESGELVELAPVAHASRTTRIKVWSLYLTILNAVLEMEPDDGKDAFGNQEWRALCAKVRDGDVWEEVVRDGYHGAEGEVDADVVINLATLLLAHARTQELNQKRLENYLAAASSPNFDLSRRLDGPPQSPRVIHRHRSRSKSRANGADTPRDLNARVKILELYTLHVLLRNNEWDYAREFITASSVLDEERREAFLQALESLREEHLEAERLEQEELQRQEKQLRQDLDEARRLRAENEERERRRVEEDRLRREGSEVDYGIEKSPSIAGSSKGQSSKRTPPATQSPPRPKAVSTKVSSPGRAAVARPKGKRPVAPTFGDRATMFMNRLRLMIEHWDASLRRNPMGLLKLIAFIMGLILMLGRKGIRERIQRIMAASWGKVKATAGMGVKVSYI